MTKRLSSKLLAVILTLAICATTVLGCLMTVSADSNSLVTFTDGSTISPTNVTDATIRLTIKLPETFPEGFVATQDGVTYGGIVSGNVALDHSSKLALTAVEVVSGTKIDDTIVSDFGDVSNDIYEDEGNVNINLGGTDDEYSFLFEVFDGTNIHYKELTFELSFKLTGADNGDKFKINATSVGVGSYLAAVCDLGTAEGIIVAGCAHALVGNGTLIETDTVNGYSVYSGSVCSLCHTTFTDPQVVPTKLPGVIKVLEYDYTKTDDDHIYFDPDLADDDELGTETDPIIIDSGLELSYLTRKAGDETKGKYYKVADGIKGFDMSGGTINLDGTLEENLDAIQASGKRHDLPANNYFQGHFDGNGATVYGLLCTGTPEAAGLFALAKGNVTIENVNVSLSYLKAKQHAGGIVGRYIYEPGNVDSALTIECCSVTDCHIETTTAGYGGTDETGYVACATGAIFGGARAYVSGSNPAINYPVKVNNCFIDLDEDHFVSLAETQAVVSVHGGIGGAAETNVNPKFTNCVVIGITPYSSVNEGYTATNPQQHLRFAAAFSNIYTDAVVGSSVPLGGTYGETSKQNYTTCMTQISASQIKGADAATNMTNLAWGSAWEVDVNRGYPNFVQAQTPDLVSDASDYELKLIGTNITYNNDGGYNFNFYYRPNKTETGNNYDPVLYVAQLNDNAVNTDGATLGSFHRLTGTPLDDAAAAAVDGLQKDDICYTLERLSAREIYNTLLATAVVVKGGKALYGGTAKISIADYAEDVVAGEAFYNDDATDDEKTADKNVAQAVLKYGKASAAALNAANDTKGTTIYWNGGKDSELEYKDGVYVISNAEELAYVVTAGPTVTKGNTYKIADGIRNIVLQKEENDNGIMQLSGHEETKVYFEDSTNKKTQWVGKLGDDTAFYGTFDGNGATIYGLYVAPQNSNIALFGTVYLDATIKNFAIKNCYLNARWDNVAIISAHAKPYQDSEKGKIVTYENIEISGCQIVREVGEGWNSSIGILNGGVGSGTNITVNNLLVHSSEIYCVTDDTVYTNLVGMTGWNNTGTGIKNSVILDCSVTLPAQVSGELTQYNFVRSAMSAPTNVYSNYAEDAVNAKAGKDTFVINTIKNEQVMGIGAVTNLPNLDWTDTWCYGDTYPSLAKGSYTSTTGKTIYWDGGTDSTLADNGETGADADNAIIIDSAEELAYVASATYDNTYGKYFKIADGIDKIVLQSETYYKDIVALDSAENVKTYFENIINAGNGSKLKPWVGNTYKPATLCFAGNFDGNGVEIYGMYTSATDVTNSGVSGDYVGGLFSIIDSATISNVAVKNSYVKLGANRANFRFGLLASFGEEADSTKGDNISYINGCTVANNYVYKQVNGNGFNGSGVVLGQNSAGNYIMQNCLVYGNDATGHYVDTSNSIDEEYNLPIIGLTRNGLVAPTEFAATHSDWIYYDGTNNLVMTVLENSVVLGTPLYGAISTGKTTAAGRVLSCTSSVKCLKNVYVDWDLDWTVTNSAGAFNRDYFLGEVVTESDLIGNTAKASEIVGIFNADNAANSNDTVWYTGNGVLLGFDKPTEMLPEAQAAYDAITFTSADCDNYGDSNSEFGIYATSLNLKTNPYISFAFAFNGDYKRDRENISVSFKYTVDGKKIDHIFGYTGDTPITSMSVPAYEQGKVLNQGGWENSANAGRYHIYRFEDIPVEALSSPIEVTVSYAGGLAGDAKTVTGSFSVEGFGYELVNAYKQTPCTYYETRIEAVKALLFYTQMIEARYGTTA